MLKLLSIHHLGLIISEKDVSLFEEKYSNKFHYDEIQGTRVMFNYDVELGFYKEFIVKEGRAKNQPIGFYHLCYSLEDVKQLEKLELYIKERKLGYPVTKLEKSGSSECGWVIFYFLKNFGFTEFNLLSKWKIQVILKF